MIVLHTLSSGSSGNAALLSKGATHVLLDAGISCRRITASLQALGLELGDLSAIFITHTHSDHICGLQTVLKRCDLPLYASPRAAGELSYRYAGLEGRLHPCPWGTSIPLGHFTVTSFPTSHDAPGSTGYRLDDAGVLTDSGYVTPEAAATLAGVRLLMLEANHDVDRLRSGPYPYYLKKRILSDQGHLSNEDAGTFAVTAAQQGAQTIVLAHLSRENNTPELALSAVQGALNRSGNAPELLVAPQESLSGPIPAKEAQPCRPSRSFA